MEAPGKGPWDTVRITRRYGGKEKNTREKNNGRGWRRGL